MKVTASTRDAELDTVQIRIYTRDKARLDRIAQIAYDATGRRPSYPMIIKLLLDAPLPGDEQ